MHLRVLAPPSVFAVVANKITAMGEPPIEVLQEEEEGEDSEPHELMWLLDLSAQVTPRWHPQLVLCGPDIEDEAELMFVRIHGAELFVSRINESGRKRGWSDTPFSRVAWIPI